MPYRSVHFTADRGWQPHETPLFRCAPDPAIPDERPKVDLGDARTADSLGCGIRSHSDAGIFSSFVCRFLEVLEYVNQPLCLEWVKILRTAWIRSCRNIDALPKLHTLNLYALDHCAQWTRLGPFKCPENARTNLGWIE